jgi:pyruvate, water dikinase
MARARRLIVPLADPEATDAARFGPKAASVAALGRAGLPVPDGFCLDAEAYRLQLAELRLEAEARGVMSAEGPEARRHALALRLGLLEQPVAAGIAAPLLRAWRALVDDGTQSVVRSSALVEDRFGSSFAGQFESYLGLSGEADFLTALRACWAALWSTRALRYMATHAIDPAETAMAVLVQRLVAARASGGGLSRTAEGEMVLSATWGLGSAIAQGEVVPDRIRLDRNGAIRDIEVGRKEQRDTCTHGLRGPARAVPRRLVCAPSLDERQILVLGELLLRAEEVMGVPVEIEWALDDAGFKLLQARPLAVAEPTAPDEVWLRHPRLSGHPAGIGWGSGRACVINCECELARVGPGDILVTRVAGPALSHILPRVAGVVAELGGSTSHLASLARERGVPMVLGVLDATRRIPDGATVAVDGVAGIVRWMT